MRPRSHLTGWPALQPLFDDRFIASWDLFEEYVARLAHHTTVVVEDPVVVPAQAQVQFTRRGSQLLVCHRSLSWCVLASM
jgi:hypothetical protein